MSRGYTMNRNWNRRAIGGLPILSVATLSAIGLLWSGALSRVEAQATGEVVVNYDVLNTLPGQAAPNGAPQAGAGAPPKSQFLPGAAPAALPPYTPYAKYGTGTPPVSPNPVAPPVVPGLGAPPSAPSSVLTTLGPDGR